MAPEEATPWKRHFSDFGGKVYLDCAAQGPFPAETVEAVRRALRLKEHPEEIPGSLYESLPGRAREAVARLLDCEPECIALASGASHGLNLAARSLPLERGDEVLLAQGEFPANVYPWLNRASDGIEVRRVGPAASRFVGEQNLIAAIGSRTRIIAISHVAFSTGYRADLKALGEACRERGIFLVVDGAQSVGAVDFKVSELPVDILATSGDKWLLGPFGTGFTYINPAILGKLRVRDVNWMNVEGSSNLAEPAGGPLRFRDGARRFDIPEAASFLNLHGLIASLSFLARVGIEGVETHTRRLHDRLVHGLDATGLRVVSDLSPGRRSGILALEGSSHEETRAIFRRLRERGIVVSVRDNLIRVSPHIYNTRADIESFLEAAAGV
ncbi:MAG TPA: aminotransferase class V-fold PLP-dependent enzyme [Candidatus Dormibacteraeota bacterium]|nr:aminotransferase class V-fold PLP-dependent enzyme [Candidatus Dormibacteraeota bacterium]